MLTSLHSRFHIARTLALAALAVSLGLTSGARAQQSDLPPPPPRYPVDGVPTQNACTTQLLMTDRACTFEVEAPAAPPNPEQARENEKTAGMFARACGRAATHPDDLQPDPLLLKSCEAAIAGAALTYCSLDGRVPLVDDEQRWSVRGRECAAELQHALSRIRTQAGVSLGCCRCVADAKCEISAPVCSKASQTGSFPFASRACVIRSCSDSCIIAPAPQDPKLPRDPRAPRESDEPPPFPAKASRASPPA